MVGCLKIPANTSKSTRCPLAPDNLKRPGTEAPARCLSSRLDHVERQPLHRLYPLQQMVALQFCRGQSGPAGISRPAFSAKCSLLLGIIPTEDHRDRRRPGRAFGMLQVRIRALTPMADPDRPCVRTAFRRTLMVRGRKNQNSSMRGRNLSRLMALVGRTLDVVP